MRGFDIRNIEGIDFLEEMFDDWFKDRPDLRSPFPAYIHVELRYRTLEKFYAWLSILNEGAGKEIIDENYREKLEAVMFKVAMSLVKTEDERITIQYPLMPRVGDILPDDIAGHEWGTGIAMKRELINRMGKRYLRLVIKSPGRPVYREMDFELAAGNGTQHNGTSS